MEKEEYLLKVRDTLVSHKDSSNVMTAARAGFIVREHVGSFEDFGYSRFKQVLEELQTRKCLSLFLTEKNALALSFDLDSSTSLKPSNHLAESEENPPYLAPSIWRAFVHVEPPGKRLLNPHTGEVLYEWTGVLHGSTWKEIKVFDVATDQQLARDFVEKNQLDIEIDFTDWPKNFTKALSADRDSFKIWNALRSKAVQEHVKRWAHENGVDYQLLLAGSKRNFGMAGHLSPGLSNRRELLLAALGRMSEEELLEVKIKARYLLEAVLD